MLAAGSGSISDGSERDDNQDGCATAALRSVFVTAPDGLKLHVRSYGLAPGAEPAGGVPAGTDAHRRPISTISRPRLPPIRRRRGACSRSIIAAAGSPTMTAIRATTALGTELADVLAVLTALDVAPAVFVGTSRGGILTMLLASARPTTIAGAVLNDIGPVIEPSGLVRIKSYVGKLPRPKSFEEGAEILRRLFGQQFTKLTDDEWLAYSHRSFKVEQRSLVPDLRREACQDARRHRFQSAAAAAVVRIRRARPRAADGAARREFRHAVGGNGRRDAGAARGDGELHRAGPGPRAAAQRSRT